MSTPYGKTSVVARDLQQTPLASIDRCFLVIGACSTAAAQNEFTAVNRASDLDALFGLEASELKTQLIAAKANASDDWMCYALAYTPVAAGEDDPAFTDLDALEVALAAELPPVEGIAFCTPRASKASVELLATLHTDLTALGRDVILLFALAGINATAQTWAQYKTALGLVINEINHDALVPVPQIHGNNLGCLLGRMTSARASIADSPLRVETGSVVGLGETPVDSAGVAFGTAQMIDLCDIRLNAPQIYVDFPGTYWTGVSTLAVPTSDFAPVEHKRIANKAARRLRAVIIPMLGNRAVNNSVSSMALVTEKLHAALDSMSKSAGGLQADLRPSQKGDVVLAWPERKQLAIDYRLRPFNHPDAISTSILLDLSNYLAQ